MSSDAEDVFDQSEEAEKKALARQFDNYASSFFQSGFREALMDDEANEKQLQEAFDSAYKIGHEIAFTFGMLQHTTKLIEGLYEDKRMLPTESPLQPLKDFNCKMDRIAQDLSELKKNSSLQSDAQVKHKFHELVQMDSLRTEASEILRNLRCPANLVKCIYND